MRTHEFLRAMIPGVFAMGIALILFSLATLAPDTWHLTPSSSAAANVQPRPLGVITDAPAITIAGATADTAATPTTIAREAHVSFVFGTVMGTYSACTAQAKTTYDGTNYLTLGSAASITVTSSTVNVWDVLQQAPVTTGVTTTTPSSTAALGFGQLTKFTFACSSYGTSAPVTVTAIYR